MDETKIIEAKKVMELGWQAREALEFEKAEQLLNQAKSIFQEQGDWFNVTECLNHLAYTEKVKASQSLIKGVAFANKALETANKNTTKLVHIYRVLFSLSVSLGNFEAALKWINEYLALQKKPEDVADAKANKALCLLRMGNAKDALALIDEALVTLQANASGIAEPHISLWLVAALLKKAVILYDTGQVAEADTVSSTALVLAREKNLKTRIVEIEEFRKNFA